MSFSIAQVRPVKDDGEIADTTARSTAHNTQSAVIPPINSRASQSDGNERRNASFPPDVPPRQSSDAAGKMSGTTITLTMTSLCLSATLSALDMTIVTTAVPAIVASLESTAGYIWVGSAFILGFTAVTPIWGSISDLWGRRPIILIALTIFLVGSLLCALAPHMNALIAGRAVQGIGASGMGVMVNTIICDMFSLRDRGLYLAITSIIWAVGSALGPVLGGVFTTRLK